MNGYSSLSILRIGKRHRSSAEGAKCKLTHLEYVALVQQRTEGGIVAKVPVQLTAGTLKAEPIEPEVLQISNTLDTVLSAAQHGETFNMLMAC